MIGVNNTNCATGSTNRSSHPSNSKTQPSVPPHAGAGPTGLDGIEVRLVNAEIGNGVFATRNFSEGETVFTDLPIVTCQFLWNQINKYKACEFCMRALETAEENARRLTGIDSLRLPFDHFCETKKELQVSCEDCEAVYCSADCRDKAVIEYHSILCIKTRDPPENHPLKVLDSYWRMMQNPPETASVFFVVKLLVKLHLDGDGSLRKRIAAFRSASISENKKMIHRMLGYGLAFISKLREMVKNVVNFDNIQEYLTPEAFLELLILVGRNGQRVKSCSFSAWVENVVKWDISEDAVLVNLLKNTVLEKIDKINRDMYSHVGKLLDNEGFALYSHQSWVNHSCVANTEVIFPYGNHAVSLVASRDISAGEEITISYLDITDLARSRYSRNKYLKNNYLFECHCPECLEQADDPNITSEESSDYGDVSDDDGIVGSD